jgi:hypothetical protein
MDVGVADQGCCCCSTYVQHNAHTRSGVRTPKHVCGAARFHMYKYQAPSAIIPEAIKHVKQFAYDSAPVSAERRTVGSSKLKLYSKIFRLQTKTR